MTQSTRASLLATAAPVGNVPGWKLRLVVMAAALAVFALALLAVSAAGKPPWMVFLVPAALASLLVFFYWPTAALVVWALCCGVTPWPVLGGEVFLYDLFTLLLLGLWFMSVVARGRLEMSGPDWAVVGIVLAAVLSILLNIGRMPEVSERFLRLRHSHLSFPGKPNLSAGLLWLSYLLAYWFASRLADTPRKIRRVLGAVLSMALINSFYALWHWINSPLGFSRQNRTSGLLLDRQDQGYLCALLLSGILVALVFRLVRGRRWVALAAAGAVLLLNLVFNFTRSVYVEFAFGLGLLLVFAQSRRVILIVLFLAIFLVLILHAVEVDKKAGVLLTHITSRQGSGLTLRMVTWMDALRISREEGGFWGIGLGNYATYSEAVIVTASTRMRRLSSAHGMYLQILAEQGVPGLMAWAAFFFVMMRYFYRWLRRSVSTEGKVFNLWLFIVLAMYLMDGVFYMGLLPPGHSHEALQVGYYVWMLLGLGVAYNRTQERQAARLQVESTP